MTAKKSYIDACLIRNFLIHYPPKCIHFRIYSLLFPLKYHKIGVSTPGFGPKRGFNGRKNAIYRCVFNVNDCVRLSNSLSTKSSPFSNSFLTFSPKNTLKLVLVPPDLVPKRVLMAAKTSYIDACLMCTIV